jgi:hypothetical protein
MSLTSHLPYAHSNFIWPAEKWVECGISHKVIRRNIGCIFTFESVTRYFRLFEHSRLCLTYPYLHRVNVPLVIFGVNVAGALNVQKHEKLHALVIRSEFLTAE